MKHKIHKIITEVINSFIINETAGVNYDILQIAKEMATDFVQNHLWNIYDNYSSREMDWEIDNNDDEDINTSDNPWEELEETYWFEINNGKSYNIFIFYHYGNEGTLKGQTDGTTIEINFSPIKNLIESRLEIYQSRFDAKQVEDLINREVYEQIVPIFEHELTHTLDKSGEKERKRKRKNDTRSMLGDTWLTAEPINSIPREDIVYAIYIYSDKEMNARIGSIGTMFQNMLYIYGNCEEFSHNSQYFQELVNEFLETDEYSDELKINDMKMVLSQISNHSDINAKPQTVKNYLKKSNNRPYSFAYYLFKNDSRLNYNRKIKHLFETNFAYGEKAVWNFYKRLYDNYIKRIYKACYASLSNSIENNDKAEN